MYCKNTTELETALAELSSGIAVIHASEKDFEFDKIKPIINSCKAEIVGGFYPGLIISEGLTYDGFIVQHYTGDYQRFLCDTGKENTHLNTDTVKKGTCLIITDSLTSGNQKFLDSLYYKFGTDFKFIGTGAGSLELVQKPCVFDKSGIYQDKAIVISLTKSVALGIKHGFERIAGPLVVTKSDGCVIQELNWENPYLTYSKTIEDVDNIVISKDNFFDFAKGYPLGISRKGNEDIVRDPISTDDQGNLICVDEIPENASLYLLKGDSNKLIKAAKQSCEEALSRSNGNAESCLLIDCVSRVLYLEDNFNKEIAEANSVLKNEHPELELEGILSIGEISTFNDGRLEIYNKTFLTTLLQDA